MSGSHKQWADSLAAFSCHHFITFSLQGRHWKWRMHGAAITLGQQILEAEIEPDLFLLTDMIDASLFKSIVCKKYPDTPIAIYFHENQLTYPWSTTDEDTVLKRDNHYSFINYSSALIADAVFFNSNFHKEEFIHSLPSFLKQFPDHTNLDTVNSIADKSSVLYVGLNIDQTKQRTPPTKKTKTILWNHRWEYDKNPEQFFETLIQLKEENIPFNLIIAGESNSKYPAIFDNMVPKLKSNIIHLGFANSAEEYKELLLQSDILPVTSIQDFFGISILEAIACGIYPLLPNRLVYPEHIPEDDKIKHLYNGYDDLYSKLKALLLTDALSFDNSWVEKYSWPKMAPIYDEALFKVQRI